MFEHLLTTERIVGFLWKIQMSFGCYKSKHDAFQCLLLKMVNVDIAVLSLIVGVNFKIEYQFGESYYFWKPMLNDQTNDYILKKYRRFHKNY